jgi:hypothetical protein
MGRSRADALAAARASFDAAVLVTEGDRFEV